jgi:type I restriction-modification system DNA methylase subunit
MKDIRTLCTLFDKYAHAQNRAKAFEDLLDAFLLPFRLCETEEERDDQLQKISNFPRNNTLAPLLAMLGELLEEFSDPLGELYMEMISKGHMGQYFTPEHVCDLLAEVSIASAEDCKTVLDPTCGSGRMLLSAAKRNRNMRFYGADVDKVCCKMAVANMLLQSLIGEIAHMDSLSNQFYAGYHLGNTLFGGYYYPWYQEFSEPESSMIWLWKDVKTEKSEGYKTFVFSTSGSKQGTLF